MIRTVQLRRYELEPGGGEEFVAWWAAWIPRVRPDHGFALEFALLDDAADEFTWAVSFEGTEDEFRAADARYAEDPRRIEAFTTATPLRRQHIGSLTPAP